VRVKPRIKGVPFILGAGIRRDGNGGVIPPWPELICRTLRMKLSPSAGRSDMDVEAVRLQEFCGRFRQQLMVFYEEHAMTRSHDA